MTLSLLEGKQNSVKSLKFFKPALCSDDSLVEVFFQINNSLTLIYYFNAAEIILSGYNIVTWD